MAAAKSAKGRKKADTRSTDDRLIDAALDLAAAKRWRDITLTEIAETAGVPIGAALLTLPGRTAILRALGRRIDRAVLESLEKDPLDGTTKDRLFDILMRRFDVLAGRQAALASISADLVRDPLTAACLASALWKSMALSLQAAGVSTEGCWGPAKAKALGAVYLTAARTWLTDDDEGLSHTMAALDKALDRAGRLASLVPGLGDGRKPAEAPL